MSSGIGGSPKLPVCSIRRIDSHNCTYIDLMGGEFGQNILQTRRCDLYKESQIKDAERDLKKWARKHKMLLLTTDSSLL